MKDPTESEQSKQDNIQEAMEGLQLDLEYLREKNKKLCAALAPFAERWDSFIRANPRASAEAIEDAIEATPEEYEASRILKEMCP